MTTEGEGEYIVFDVSAKTFQEALEQAADEAKNRHGPGWFRLIDVRIYVENPIRDYRIVLGT